MSDVQNSQLHAAPNKSWAVGTGVEYVAQIARASVEVIEANRIAQTVPETPLEILCTDVRWLGQDRWSEPLALPHRKCFFISEKHGKCSGLSPAFGGVLEVVQCVFAKLMVRGHIQHSSLCVWWISSFLQLWKIMEVHYKIQSCALFFFFSLPWLIQLLVCNVCNGSSRVGKNQQSRGEHGKHSASTLGTSPVQGPWWAVVGGAIWSSGDRANGCLRAGWDSCHELNFQWQWKWCSGNLYILILDMTTKAVM